MTSESLPAEKQLAGKTLHTVFYRSPVGNIKISGSENGITELLFTDDDFEAATIPVFLQPCIAQLDEYFHRKRKTFNVKLDLRGSVFQIKVWSELLKIHFGKTISYKELAEHVGDVSLTRAVGNANGKNPIGIIIPCHRVIGNDGSLTGYAGGMHRKEWLLQFEQNAAQGNLFNTELNP